jgi:predicted DNA-binding transcriptional regulator YafY
VLGGMDLYELAEKYGTTARTIRRDFEALQEVGIPLVEERVGKRKKWRVCFDDRLVKRLSGVLDASHFLALRLAMGEGAVSRRSTGIFALLEDLSDGIEKALGPNEKKHLSAIDACFLSYERFAYRQSPPEVFWPLVDAIGDQRLCLVQYRAPRAKPRNSKFLLLPLRIFAHDGAPYVLGWVPRYKQVVTLNLQRLVSLKVQKEQAKPPPGFDAEKWQSAAFGLFTGGEVTKYRLRFDESVAPYIRERTWHPTQKTKELRNGSLELEFTCSASYEVTAWVASWRSHVEALAPATLRAELRDLGAWMATTYRAAK